jgi:hypothetical protein
LPFGVLSATGVSLKSLLNKKMMLLAARMANGFGLTHFIIFKTLKLQKIQHQIVLRFGKFKNATSQRLGAPLCCICSP